jgi:hypothetical protein
MPGPLTCTFKSVLHGCHIRTGGNVADLHPDTAAALTEFINSAYKHGYRYYEWPDCLEVEERTSDANKLIEWMATGETVIETIFQLSTADPRISVNPLPQKFKIGRDGIYTPLASTDYWAVFRPRVPVFTSEEYASGTAYAAGNTVYYPTTGECYECIASSTGNVPTNTTYWSKLDFLDLLAEPVKAGVHAAILRDEGQYNTSVLMEDAMADLLLRELERIELQSGQFRVVRVN